MSTFALENEDLCQALRRRVKHYKREHPTLSSQQIAKRFNMSSSTLNRIENQDIRNPTIDQVLKVLRGTGETDDLLTFIEEYYPDIAETYRRVYSENSSIGFVQTDVEDFLTNPDYFLILVLAFSKTGITKEFIKDELGNAGLSKLNFLKEKGVLTPDSRGVYSSTKNVNLSQVGTKKLFNLIVDTCYKPENIGKKENYLAIRTESLNKTKAVPKLITLLKKFHQDVNDVFNDPENLGNDHLFVGMAMDYLVEPKKNNYMEPLC